MAEFVTGEYLTFKETTEPDFQSGCTSSYSSQQGMLQQGVLYLHQFWYLILLISAILRVVH